MHWIKKRLGVCDNTMSNVNCVTIDSGDIEIRIRISGNKFQEQRYFKNGRPRETPKERISPTFVVEVSTPMTKFKKELVFPIFDEPLENLDYIISLQTEGQPKEIFDQENMNEKTISEVGIKPFRCADNNDCPQRLLQLESTFTTAEKKIQENY